MAQNETVCANIGRNEADHLTFAGQDTLKLAEQYGTPLYLMDEDRIRHNCRVYKEAFDRFMPEGSVPAYASKAASYMQIYRVVAEEGMHADVASIGEMYTAYKAGLNMEHVCYHGNAKTDEEIRFAIGLGVGRFVADNEEELRAIDREAACCGIRQKILLRVTPGIDPHTYEAISTGKVDSKFGAAIETGQAEEITKVAMSLEHVELQGFHCHVGSQVFAEDVFERTAEVMLDYITRVRDALGFETRILDLGGGYGVRYLESDPCVDIGEKIGQVAKVIRTLCAERKLKTPAIMMEPGRSIAADAGMTLYTVQTVKKIPGYRNYVAIDGGMTDNPRHALYGSEYTILPAGRLSAERDMVCTLAGHCCESGDVIGTNVMLPADIHRGELVAVCTTGAYHFSMASNYNRYGRPALVHLKQGESFVAVKRESLDDLIRNDQ